MSSGAAGAGAGAGAAGSASAALSSSLSLSSSSSSMALGGAEDSSIVRFQSFQSCAPAGFWQELAKLKVDVLGLDQEPLSITGTYVVAPPGSSSTAGGEALPPRLSVGVESLASAVSSRAASTSTPAPAQQQYLQASHLRREARVPGVLRNVNTDEAFRRADKQGWLQALGEQIWEDIQSGEAVTDPGRLARFAVLCFADIKRNAFLYWFAFPAVAATPPFKHACPPTPLAGLGGFFSDAECLLLQNGLEAFRRLRLERFGDPHPPPFFLLLRSLTAAGSAASLSLEVAPLDAYDTLNVAQRQDCLFAALDPGTVPLAPAWPLRNFLLLLANRWGLRSATVLCYRGRLGADTGGAGGAGARGPTDVGEAARAAGASFVMHVELAPLAQPEKRATTGWERNRGRFMPRRMDLSGLMDPLKLAEASVDLNLKLMRWRLLPALDAPRLAATRCLLLGAGTLGCGVARCLLGWGVRTITLVDNGRVALSNPVRQSLFEYADCLEGGKPKAAAAAAALKRIFPGVVAEGHSMTIPMPGHPLAAGAEAQAAAKDVAKLDELVRSHDVVFLLTDTRESRWLPTVMAAAHDKLLLNAALGFDTFLVMRHGGAPEGRAQAPIGCYFCNDVVAPEDSTKDRTLDQQCTVTRPGLAQLASALAVELMVALRHHPVGHRAPADTDVNQGEGGGAGATGGGLGRLEDPDRPLGILPQQIRGFLSHFTQILPVTRPFDHCAGCAPAVVAAYRAEGFQLVLNVCNGSGAGEGGASYLEELTGLAKMRREADAVEMLWLDDDASLEEEGEGEEREEQLPELDLRLDEQGTRAGPAPVPVGGSKAGEGSSGRNGHGSRKGKEAGEEEVVEVM